jgi:hypothetical protein
MLIISPAELRANQKKYFDLAAHETIFVARRNDFPIQLVVVTDEEELPTREEVASLQKALDDVKSGRVTRMKRGESLDDFLDRTSHV